jgi:CheY-like chemotaxis protein
MNRKLNKKRIQGSDNNAPLILVVEDDPDNLIFISHTLIFLKYNFITATEGKTALNLATNYKIDLILLDLILPDINGFELVNSLKKANLTKNIPIIALTALAREQDRDRALNAGCDDYLSKPYLIDDLDRKIRRFFAFLSPFCLNYQSVLLARS